MRTRQRSKSGLLDVGSVGQEVSEVDQDGSGKRTCAPIASSMAQSDPSSRSLFALTLAALLSACATSRNSGAQADVTLLEPYEIISASNLTSTLAYKVRRLAEIDPDEPTADEGHSQTLSLFGREDLIAATSDDYQPNGCASGVPASDVLDEIESRARETSIVIVNESHERSRHRGFTAEVAHRLRPLGYDILALETLANPGRDTPAQHRPDFLTQPELSYLSDDDGFYLSEAAFGRLGRQAKALGYRLLPYEFSEDDNLPDDASWSERIAVREEGQAANLLSLIRARPDAKVLIHVGYSHAAEVPRKDGARWMAARLREKTGVDALTISQTSCRGGGDGARLAALPASEPAGTFDLVVDHPEAEFVRGRPVWRRAAGDRAVDIPRALHPAAGWRIIEARPPGEPVTSVPMDRVAIRPNENVALMLPPGRYVLRAIDVRRDVAVPLAPEK